MVYFSQIHLQNKRDVIRCICFIQQLSLMHQGPRRPFQSGRAKKSCQCKETLSSVFRHLSCICVDYEQSLFSLGPSSKTPEARSHAYKSERVLSAARSTYVNYRAILAKYKWNLLHLRLINTSLSFFRRVTKHINYENGKTLAESILLR